MKYIHRWYAGGEVYTDNDDQDIWLSSRSITWHLITLQRSSIIHRTSYTDSQWTQNGHCSHFSGLSTNEIRGQTLWILHLVIKTQLIIQRHMMNMNRGLTWTEDRNALRNRNRSPRHIPPLKFMLTILPTVYTCQRPIPPQWGDQLITCKYI